MAAPKLGANTGNRGKGRPKGSLNKTTASIKQALTEAFEMTGGVKSLVKWANQNETEFYRLWSKLVPQDVTVAGQDGGPIMVTVRFVK